MKTKNIKTIIFLFLFCGIFILFPNIIKATEIETSKLNIANEAIESTEVENIQFESTEKQFTDSISTVNIKCYVQPEIAEYKADIHFTIFNKDDSSIYTFDLNSINDYKDAINVNKGNYAMYATIDNNDGTYSLYVEGNENSFVVNEGKPINIACAYGNADFLNEVNGYLPAANIYADNDIEALKRNVFSEAENIKTATEQNFFDVDNETKKATQELSNENTFKPSKNQKEQETTNELKDKLYFIFRLIVSLILLFILLIVAKKREHKNQ